MKKWLCPSMTMMALLALFALVMPSIAWACPVTGRVGDAATVCQRSNDKSGSGAMACCAQMQAQNIAGQSSNCLGSCCKSVPQLPGSDKNHDTSLTQTHADTASILSQLSQAAHTIAMASVPPTAPLSIEPPNRVLLAVTRSVVLLPAQYAPCALAGRAPPLS